MKKLILLIFIFIMVVSSCNKKTEEKAEEKVTEVAAELEKKSLEKALDEGSEVETKDGTITIKTEGGQELVVANDTEKGVPIPDDYPKDILPVYSEEFISMATSNDGNYLLAGFTNDSMEKVKAFYEKALEGGTVVMKEDLDESYVNMGNINSATYTVNLVPADEDTGYISSFTLIIMPSTGNVTDSALDDNEELSENQNNQTSKSAPLVIPDDVEWPSNYPDEVLPIYPTGSVEATVVEDDGEEMMIGLMTEDEKENVYEFYKEIMKDAPDYAEIDMAPTIMLMGTLKDVVIQITLMENGSFTGADPRFKTVIQLIYNN